MTENASKGERIRVKWLWYTSNWSERLDELELTGFIDKSYRWKRKIYFVDKILEGEENEASDRAASSNLRALLRRWVTRTPKNATFLLPWVVVRTTQWRTDKFLWEELILKIPLFWDKSNAVMRHWEENGRRNSKTDSLKTRELEYGGILPPECLRL